MRLEHIVFNMMQAFSFVIEKNLNSAALDSEILICFVI